MNKKIIGAFSWDFFGTLVGYGATFVSSVILARILTSEQFGIVAMAMAFVYLFNSIGEFGLKQAIIQSTKIDQISLSSVFYINLFLGILLTIVTLLSANSIAIYFDELLLSSALKLLSITFIINSLSVVQISLFSRDLNFKSLSQRLIAAKLIAAVFGVSLALTGYGIYSLVWQEIIFSILNAVLLWYLSSWKPSRTYSWTSVKELFHFGKYIFFGQFLNQFINQIDELIIGKLFNSQTLGYFGRSNSITQIINGLSTKSITAVFFPVLSGMRNDREQFERTFINVFSIICITSFGFAGIAILSSKAIILGLFGPQWHNSISIFEILLLKLFTYPASSFLIIAIIANGNVKQDFNHGIVRKLLRLSPYIFAALYGFTFFLYASVAISFINVFYNNIINSHYNRISILKQLRPIIITCAIFLITMQISNMSMLKFDNMYYDAISKSLVFCIIYGGINLALYYKQISSVISQLKRSKSQIKEV